MQFDKLKIQIDEILNEQKRIEQLEAVSSDLLAPIRTAVEIMNGFERE